MLPFLTSVLHIIGLPTAIPWGMPVATPAVDNLERIVSPLVGCVKSPLNHLLESINTSSFTEQFASLEYAKSVAEQPDILDNRIKIIVATSAAVIELVLLFFLFKNTPFLYDTERKSTETIERFSWMKLSCFVGLYTILFSFLLSFWLNNSSPKLSFSLFGFASISIITSVFHHRLKKSQSMHQSQTHVELKAFLGLLFPLATFLLTIYFSASVFYDNIFPEMPWPIMLFHIVLAMIHVAVRTIDSQIVDAHWVQHFLNKADHRKSSP
jgi:hypothetical protein